MADTTWKPDFTKDNAYEGMPASYAALVAKTYVPTKVRPLNPVQEAALAGQLPLKVATIPAVTDLTPAQQTLLGITTIAPLIPLLDTSNWGLLEFVHQWFNDFWNAILSWFHQVVDWIYDKVKPLIDVVWGWITTEVGKVWGWIKDEVGKVWGWIVTEVGKVRQWIVTETLKVWDWIVKEVGKVYSWIGTEVGKVWGWITTEVGKVWGWITTEVGKAYDWIKSATAWLWTNIQSGLNALWQGMKDIAAAVADKVGEISNWFSDQFIDPFLDWLLQLPVKLWEAFLTTIKSVGATLLEWWKGTLQPIISWLSTNIGRALNWLMSYVGQALSVVVGWGLDIYGFILQLASKFITPIFMKIFDWFEDLGPVSPGSGRSTAESVASLVTVTMAGLGAMTLAGELLHPLKQIGLGNIAAMIYDLTNYKMLTAAFVGVLAGIYIRTPLTYYYNELARPNIPDERSLLRLAGEYAITKDEYTDNMKWHGYPSQWIEKLYELADRPLTPRLFTQIASVGILDDELIDRELKNAGYNEKTIPYLKTWLKRQAEGDLKTLMTSLPITRFKEGFDTEDDLTKNLTALGVDGSVMPKYVFAARLSYLYDYQTDLKTYYIDAYHRRDIEEPELRSNLVSIGIDPERLALIVSQQKIKRLAAPKVAAPEELGVEFDTIRDKRKKNIITRDDEVSALVSIGKELPYALAIADNDDAALAEKVPTRPLVVIPFYQTDVGKVTLATIRWQRRKGYIERDTEIKRLTGLEMTVDLATATADEDDVMIAEKRIEKPELAIPFYETEEGKIRVDTIRRLRRQRQISPEDELSSLTDLEMSASMAQAIVDNDELRLRKETSTPE